MNTFLQTKMPLEQNKITIGKISILFLIVITILSCKGAKTRSFRFYNSSSQKLTLYFFGDKKELSKYDISKKDYVDFAIYTDETRFYRVPPSGDSIVIVLENNKIITESCKGNDIVEQEKCNLNKRSMFKLDSYEKYDVSIWKSNKYGDGFKYVFTDEDALRAK